MRYLSADYETGGLRASSHAPISFALCLWDNGELLDSQEWRFPLLPEMGYTPKALEINGTAWAEMEFARAGRLGSLLQNVDETWVLRDIKAWAIKHNARHLPIIAHNAEFDMAFYLASVFRTKVDPLLGGWLCTMRLARNMLPDLKSAKTGKTSHNLDTVCAHFGLCREGEVHGATEDAELAGRVYARLVTP